MLNNILIIVSLVIVFIIMLYALFVVSSDSDDASEEYFSIHYGDITETYEEGNGKEYEEEHENRNEAAKRT